MKKFSRELNGYKKEEVNSFINDVIIQIEKLLNKVEENQKEISDLKEKLSYYEKIENSLNLAFNNAYDTGESIRKSATNEASSIILDAKKNASRIVNDALIQNEKITLKTEQAAKNLRIFKNRLRNIVEEQLHVVDEIDALDIEE